MECIDSGKEAQMCRSSCHQLGASVAPEHQPQNHIRAAPLVLKDVEMGRLSLETRFLKHSDKLVKTEPETGFEGGSERVGRINQRAEGQRLKE